METILMGVLIIIAFIVGYKLGKNAVILTPEEKKAIKHNISRLINKKPTVKIFNALDNRKPPTDKITEELDKSFAHNNTNG